MYRSIIISKNDLPHVEAMIPEEYRSGIISGEYTAVAVYDDMDPGLAEGDSADLLAAVLLKKHGKWLEIVYASMSDVFEDRGSEGVLTFLIQSAVMGDDVIGAYAECTPDQEELLTMLQNAGFETEKSKSMVYEFRPDMIETGDLKPPAEDPIGCVSLRDADRRLRGVIAETLGKDDRDIPVSMPIDWGKYDDELSILYEREKGYGAFLVSRTQDYVNVEAVIADGNLAFSYMGFKFLNTVKEKCDPGTVIIASAMNNESEKLIKRLVPRAERADVYHAFYLV